MKGKMYTPIPKAVRIACIHCRVRLLFIGESKLSNVITPSKVSVIPRISSLRSNDKPSRTGLEVRGKRTFFVGEVVLAWRDFTPAFEAGFGAGDFLTGDFFASGLFAGAFLVPAVAPDFVVVFFVVFVAMV